MSQGKVIYEVALFVDGGIAAEYRAWLDGHVREMLAIPGFVSAQVLELLDPAAEAGEIALCVQYHVHGMAALEDYVQHRAAGMREQGIARFGGRFRAQRRVLQVLASH